MHDLVKFLEPLQLPLYQGTEMHDNTLLGEGGSYKVFRCKYPKKHLVAVKVMKLPFALSLKENEDLRKQVVCIIKDLEVMRHSPLAEHKNILGLLGYGWNLSGDSALPFLVTEYADQGTLRDFLQGPERNGSVVPRLKLCGDIASGLHTLHLCGVSHGDLKLENVLVFREADAVGSKEKRYSAKLVSQLSNSVTMIPSLRYEY